MKLMPLLFPCLFSLPAFSQKQDFPGGIYQLTGVMEMASGFRFNADHSFDFYVSYGAMDREGKGTWAQVNDVLLLNTPPKPGQDFTLLAAGKKEHNTIVIQVEDPNVQILPYVICRIQTPEGEQVQQADGQGRIEFTASAVTLIELVHEIWANAPAKFIPEAGQNDFRFKLEPWIMDIECKDLRLVIQAGELIGGHPLMAGSQYRYVGE